MYFSASNHSVGEDDGQVVMTVLLRVASSQTVTVDFATQDGTATTDEDYMPISGTLLFTPGERSRTIPVTLISGCCCHQEPVEKFCLELSNPSGVGHDGSPLQVNVTILDLDSGSLG